MHRKLHPVRRTKTNGTPLKEVSPCKEWKISVMSKPEKDISEAQDPSLAIEKNKGASGAHPTRASVE